MVNNNRIGGLMQNMVDLKQIQRILKESDSIALVGLSPKENRPSNIVGRYLIEAGFDVIPINPGHSEILGRRCYPSLSALTGHVDIVDIFRKSEDVLPIVEDAIAIGAKVIWMQLGIVNYQAAARAREAGMAVIMDRCIKIDHSNLL
jgi:uncharacterized protein